MNQTEEKAEKEAEKGREERKEEKIVTKTLEEEGKAAKKKRKEKIPTEKGEEKEKRVEKEEKIEPTEEEEEKTAISPDEKLLLAFSSFIQQNKLETEITGFQIKDFFEETFPEKDVDEIYANLKNKGLLSKRKDTEEFYVSLEGRKEAEKHEEFVEKALSKVVPSIKERLKESELLRRLLWLAYQDKYEFRSYFPEIKGKLSTNENIYASFFNADRFLEDPKVEKMLRKIRKEEKEEVQEKLNEFSKDPAFLKTLAILRPEKVIDELDVKAQRTLSEGFKDMLSLYIDKSKIGNVLSKLFLLGITESKNFFNADIDSILESNIDKIENWLGLDKKKIEESVRTNWNLLLDLGRAVRGYSVKNLEEFVNAGAFIPSKEGFIVRKESEEIWKEVSGEIEEKLEEKVGGIENVVPMPFFEREKAENLEGKVIVTLHAKDHWSNQYHYPAFVKGSLENAGEKGKNVLEKNVILVVSPTEVGFEKSKHYTSTYKSSVLEEPDTNKEYNAMGKVKGVGETKDRFPECNWKSMNDDYVVKKAKQVIEEKKVPKISFGEALNKIAEMEDVYKETLYLIADKHTYKTAIGRGHFSEDTMWRDVWSNIELRYPSLIKEDFEEIKNKIKNVMEKQAEVNLLRFREKEKIYESFQGDLDEKILSRIRNLKEESKKALFVFLNHLPENGDDLTGEYGNYIDKFNLLYRLYFQESFEKSLPRLLTALGVVTKGTWISSKGNYLGVSYNFVAGLEDLKDRILEEIGIRVGVPDLGAFKNKYRGNIPELAGLDFLIQHDGIAGRDEIRDALFNISRKGWIKFQDHQGLISSKQEEKLIINPQAMRELKNWLVERKKQLLRDKEEIKDLLKATDILDYKLELDEEKGIYTGHVMGPTKEKINVVICPWYLPDYSSLLGERNLVIVTERASADLIKQLKELEYKKILLLTLEEEKFRVFSNLAEQKFVESVVKSFEKAYKLESREVEAPEKEKIEEAEEEVAGPELPGVSPGPPEDLFDKFIECKDGNFPRNLMKDRPVVILLHDTQDDSYGTALQIICRELYHQLKGDLPTPKIHSEKRSVERELKGGRMVQLVDESNKEFFKGTLSRVHGVDDVNWDWVGERLRELYSQKFGFIIFQIPTELVTDFRRKLEERVGTQKPQIHELNPKFSGGKLLDLEKERAINLIEVKRNLSNLLWGNPQKEEELKDKREFDKFFSSCEEKFWEKLIEYKNRPIGSKEKRLPHLLVNRSPKPEDDPEKNESDLHFLLKIFVTKFLIETEKYTFESVDTEKDTPIAHDTGNKVIPDIQAGKKVYEIETLYSSGEPLSRIMETVKKYKKNNLSPEINIVLTNLDAFLWFRELKKTQKDIKEEWKMDVKFRMPSLGKKKLMSIDKIKDPMLEIL